jgi:hypothetical protein
MAYFAVYVYTDAMHRTPVLRLAAIALLIPSTIALAGCGPKSAAKSSSSSTTASSGSCAAGYVSGQIGGQPKCLQNGQQCQDANASDYKKYGFACTKNNGRYELKKS